MRKIFLYKKLSISLENEKWIDENFQGRGGKKGKKL